MKKIMVLLLLFFASATLFLVSAQSTGENIMSFGDKISINKNGTIGVKETIIYSFGDLEKHGIYRTIPYIKTNSDGKKFQLDLNNFSVTDENGLPLQFSLSDDGANTTLKIGDANRLVSGVKTYVIGYQVSGALSYFSDHDELYWNVTGNNWTVPIYKYDAQITLPRNVPQADLKTVCYLGPSGSTKQDCYIFHEQATTEVSSKDTVLNPNEGMTVVFGFPKNIVAILEPKPYVAFADTFLGKLLIGLMGLIGLIWYVLAPVYIIYLWIRYGRDPKATVGVTSAWFDPPKSPEDNRPLTPGEVGTLGDETVDLKDISSTIVDLARRGYIIIDERKKGDFYLVKSKNPDVKLLDFEKKLISGFFGAKKEIRIKDEELYSAVEDVKKSLYGQVVTDKLFDKNPQTTRTIYYVIAGVAVFTGNIGLAIVAFIFGRIMPRKTLGGVNAANVAKSLKNFLESQERQLEFQADKQMMFEKLLPYAIAFGVEKIWAKRFQNIDIRQPDWYRSYSTANFNSFIFISSLNSSMSSFQSAATPTRSSSGFSSGFGGGGFSGGGGGGGGGGSW